MCFCYIVINKSVVVFVGEPVTVRQGVRVTIDCSNLIQARDGGITNFNVTWYKDGIVLSNGSATHVLISKDRSLCIITDTLLAAGGQIGTDGNYTCEVCPSGSSGNCTSRNTCQAVCGE